jgi:hypothetical protein
MNFTETFEQFSSRLTTTDLALYAGAGLILWVLFKDRLSPVQKILTDLINKAKSFTGNKSTATDNVVVPEIKPVVVPESNKEDVFFKLVVSWKQTRDLAVKSGCSEAVKVADQMFPFLSPNVCGKEEG